MKSISITGTKRTDLGKKATKEVRKQGLVPCVISVSILLFTVD